MCLPHHLHPIPSHQVCEPQGTAQQESGVVQEVTCLRTMAETLPLTPLGPRSLLTGISPSIVGK
jgi:hypothetical protein